MKNLGITKKNMDFFNLEPLLKMVIPLNLTLKWWVIVFEVEYKDKTIGIPIETKISHFSNNSLNKLRFYLEKKGVEYIRPCDYCMVY